MSRALRRVLGVLTTRRRRGSALAVGTLLLATACTVDTVAPPSVAPEIVSVSLTQALNPALPTTVAASIVADTIVLEIPGVVSDVSRLVPTIVASDPGATVRVGTTTIRSGVTTFDGRTDVVLRVSSGDAWRDYTVRVVVFTGLPVVSVFTDGAVGITSREVYVTGWVSVFGGKNRPEWSLDSARTRVRGRGNSTWNAPKKPYRLKLGSSVSMLGMPANRDWVLLANYWDQTLARNAVAFKLSELVGMAYTPRCTPVEVNINGVFQGAYQLCEQVETSLNRVPAGVGGWLLCLDSVGDLEVGDVSFATQAVRDFSARWGGSVWVYKSPDPPSSAERTRIEGQLHAFEAALYGEGFAHPDTGYARHLDVESFIKWYLVQELVKNNDARFFKSVYLYATATGKITFGPLWDFDLSFGGYPYIPEPTGWRIREIPWFQRMRADPAFIAKVKAQWQELYAKRAEVDAFVVAYTNQLSRSQRRTHAVWAPYGPKPAIMAPGDGLVPLRWLPPASGAYSDADYANEVQALRSWLAARFDWLNANIGSI